jgi:hypothetical protein
MSNDRSNLLGSFLESLLETAGDHGGAIGLAALFYYGSLVEYLNSVDFLGFVWGDLAKFFGLATILFLIMLVFIHFILEKAIGPVLTRALKRISDPKKRENWEGGLSFGVAALIIVVFAVGCLWCWAKVYANGPRTEGTAFTGDLHTNGPAQGAETPVAEALPHPPSRPNMAVVSLGNFSDGHYELDLWRDDSSNGQVVGRISVFPQDVSKSPFIGELSRVDWDLNTSQLRFTSHMSFGVVSFDGIFTENGFEGVLREDSQPHHATFRRLESQYEQHYETRQAWNEEMAKSLACCGPTPK